MIVGMFRKGSFYSRDFKLVKDSNETFLGTYYKAPVGAKVFPHPHKFAPQHSRDSRLPPREGIGEVYSAKRIWHKNDVTFPNNGLNFCGKKEYYTDGITQDLIDNPPDPPCECEGLVPAIATANGVATAVAVGVAVPPHVSTPCCVAGLPLTLTLTISGTGCTCLNGTFTLTWVATGSGPTWVGAGWYSTAQSLCSMTLKFVWICNVTNSWSFIAVDTGGTPRINQNAGGGSCSTGPLSAPFTFGTFPFGGPCFGATVTIRIT